MSSVAVGARLPVVLSTALALALLVTMASCDAKPPGRHLFVAPGGSDSGHGTQRRPWRTLRRALRSPRPGDVVILAPGTYGKRGRTIRIERSGTGDRPITIRAAAGRTRPRIRGHVRIDAGHVRLQRLVFDGPTGRVLQPTDQNPRGEEILIWVRGDDVEISRSEIRYSAWHAGIYVTGDDARILRNRIHDNGDRGDPSQANVDQGIYWDTGGGGVIANNLIANNVAWGIQLYREPTNVKVVHNTVVGNGRGGLLVSDNAAHNVIANNIFAFNGRPYVTYALSGEGNSLTGNLFWSNGSAALGDADPLNPVDNIEADPLFAGPGDYRLRPGSPALGRALPQYRVHTDFRGKRRGRHAALGAYEGS
jgi:parallel beta helix pectate lyase-like protein/uncharacterized protein DUF1565